MNKKAILSIIVGTIISSSFCANAAALSCSVLSEHSVSMSTPVKSGEIISDSFVISHSCQSEVKSGDLPTINVKIAPFQKVDGVNIYAVGANVFDSIQNSKTVRCDVSKNGCEFKIDASKLKHFDTKINVIIDAKKSQFKKTRDVTDILNITYSRQQ